MRTALYVIWIAIPCFFFLLALWTKLEQVSTRGKKHGRQVLDFTKQGVFVSVCVGICILIDQFLLEPIFTPILPDFIPLGFVRVMLLPVILYIGALIVGGSKPAQITRGGGRNVGRRHR